MKRAPGRPKKRAEDDESVQGLLTRGGAAKALGVSLAMVRKWERLGALEPLKLAGINYHNERDIELFRAKRQGKPRRVSNENNVSANVFDLLAKNTSPIDIVRKLRVHPDIVEGLHHQWARMSGSLVWEPKELETLAALVGGMKPRSAAECVDRVSKHVIAVAARASADASRCAVCRSDPARFCGGCAPTKRPRG